MTLAPRKPFSRGSRINRQLVVERLTKDGDWDRVATLRQQAPGARWRKLPRGSRETRTLEGPLSDRKRYPVLIPRLRRGAYRGIATVTDSHARQEVHRGIVRFRVH